MSQQTEQYLELSNGRILAYDDAGNRDSKSIVIFFHGVFSIGDATRPSPALLTHNVHYIAPTLAGWGNSSPRTNAGKTPYYVALAQDTTALLEHLHPGCGSAPAGEYKLYISGGSFGTVPAQMLFNASGKVFPARKHIVACFLGAAMSPFKYHKEYAKDLTWDNYLAVGPPSRFIPFNLIQRLGSVVLGRKLQRVEDAESFIRSLIFNHVQDDEKAMFEKWKKERGVKDGQLETEMAANIVKSVGKSWDGFLEVPKVLHGDWGFKMEDIQTKPVIITFSEGDKMTPEAWGKWLGDKYPGARLREVTGGHLASLWSIDPIWDEFIRIGS